MPSPIQVLHEDDTCLILNKPAGLAVQGGAGVSQSLDSLLARMYSPRPLLVHRLDRDTSGVILVAKGKASAAHFSRLMGEGSLCEKKYLAVCAGKPGRVSGEIRLEMEVHGKNKHCETRFTVLRSGPFPAPCLEAYPQLSSYGNVFSLMELEPGTGRMHQLRRHMALTHTPILGDDKYGDFPLNKALGKSLKLKQLLLHAHRLRISVGQGIPPLDIRAPLPPYFLAFLEFVGLREEIIE